MQTMDISPIFVSPRSVLNFAVNRREKTVENIKCEVLKSFKIKSIVLGTGSWEDKKITLFEGPIGRVSTTNDACNFQASLIRKNHRKLSDSINSNTTISTSSFYSYESENETKQRRTQFRHLKNVRSRKSIVLDEYEKELQNTLVSCK